MEMYLVGRLKIVGVCGHALLWWMSLVMNQQMGINGALMQRKSAPPELNQALNGFACTMGVEDYDLTEAKILILVARSHYQIRIARNGFAGILFGHGREYIWCSSTRSECQIE